MTMPAGELSGLSWPTDHLARGQLFHWEGLADPPGDDDDDGDDDQAFRAKVIDPPVGQVEGQQQQVAHLPVGQGVLDQRLPDLKCKETKKTTPGATTNRPSSVCRSGPGACMIRPS